MRSRPEKSQGLKDKAAKPSSRTHEKISMAGCSSETQETKKRLGRPCKTQENKNTAGKSSKGLEMKEMVQGHLLALSDDSADEDDANNNSESDVSCTKCVIFLLTLD